MKDAASQLGCSIGVVYFWIETGQLAARRAPGQDRDPLEPGRRGRLPDPHRQSGHLNPPPGAPGPDSVPAHHQPRMSAPSGIIYARTPSTTPPYPEHITTGGAV